MKWSGLEKRLLNLTSCTSALQVIFGECVSGFDVIEAVNALSKGQKNNELIRSNRAQITDTGQLRRGSYRAPPQAP